MSSASIDGNAAAAGVARMSGEVVAIHPITTASPMGPGDVVDPAGAAAVEVRR